MSKPNILFVMTDQQRFDTIAALGNPHIHTPNLDRLARRGVSFSNAFTTCAVCLPARYTIRTGCEPATLAVFENRGPKPAPGQAPTMEGRCGPYLARVMGGLGYRTFGVGKFHTYPWDEDIGYETQLHSEELYATPDQRSRDAYAAWVAREYPAFRFVEGLMGERTEMYYMPQMSPLPAEATVEAWAADRTIEQIRRQNPRPWFGMVSFVGPHPPFAPPVPLNRMYDPDRMPNPVRGNLALDHMDEQIPWMNYAIWAEDINDAHSRVLKARYYGEISYIDTCIGRILDAVEQRSDAGNTVICFFSDHGDFLGDHHGWQKESFFDASCRIPFLLSWPARVPAGVRREEFVCLTDLFAIATHAAGEPQRREGADVLAMLAGEESPRSRVIGMIGAPGTPKFRIIVQTPEWKYIFMSNGGREQLFRPADDPDEFRNLAADAPDAAEHCRRLAVEACQSPCASHALDGDRLYAFPYQPWPLKRIHQFDQARGIRGFPPHPADVFKLYPPRPDIP